MKISATHLIEEGVYLLERSWGYNLECDGVKLPNSEAVVHDITKVVQVNERQGDLLCYVDADGATMSTAAYADKLVELLDGTVGDEDGLIYPSIDAEFEHRKFVARWRPSYAPNVIERTPVEIEISEVRVNSGDPDIVSLWNSPDIVNDRRLYNFNRDATMIRVFRQQCVDAGLACDVPSHSALRYAKIGGDYAFDDSFSESKRGFIGTLEQCRAEKARCVGRVSEVVRRHEAKAKNLQLMNAGQVLIDLQAIQSRLQSVYAKQSSLGDLSSVKKQVAALVENISANI